MEWGGHAWLLCVLKGSRSIPMIDELQIDYDVVVVGAGVAGVTAAVRLCRPEAIGVCPATVAVCEGDRVGGLVAWKNWRNYHLTGPGYRFRQADWYGMLEDARQLGITFLNETVISTQLKGAVKMVHTGSRSIRCLAIILAPGMRPMRNAGNFDFAGGVITAFGTAQDTRMVMQHWLESSGGGRPALWGTENSLPTFSALKDLNPEVIIEPPYSNGVSAAAVHYGTVLRLLGEERVQGIEYRSEHGALRNVECSCVFLDFNGYMAATHTSDFLYESGLEIRDGFIPTDHDQQTNQPGVFAAGDITGGMFAVSKALYQGTRAAFSALRWVHRCRFHDEPALYPYFHADQEVDITCFWPVGSVKLSFLPGADQVLLELRLAEAARCQLTLARATASLCSWVAVQTGPFDMREAIMASEGLSRAETSEVLMRLVQAGALKFGTNKHVSYHH
jgi:thioredoxin reductase (NADPH)